MIDGFNKVYKEFPNIQLIIAGEGELEKKLKSKVKNLHLDEKIIFIGYEKNIYNYMHRSICFLLTQKTYLAGNYFRFFI